MKPARQHQILFEPIQIGPKILRNRFYQTPHGAYGSGKPGTTAFYRGMRAEGGWAAVNTQQAPVDPHSDDAPYVTEHWWGPEDAAAYALMAEHVHAHGALAGMELHHGGAVAGRRDSRWPALAPSAISPELGPPHLPPETPKAMDADDIERVQRAFVDGAVRARDAGFDIVYVYGGHGHLMAQFLSPFTNRRTDRYGGSLENRARMWVETLGRIRDAVGRDCAIAARVAADARGPFGADLADTQRFVQIADDLVDLWDITLGSHVNMGVDMGPSRLYAEGYQLEWSGRIREVTRKPIVGVSRLTNPDRMAEIVRSGVWDVIGAARASIADPFLPRKVSEGRLEDIRECMGINACTSKWIGGHLGCAQNATAGEEFRRGWHPERFTTAGNADRPVLIVGAGPAGLECATVLGRRGMHAVHLVDAAPALGGHLSALTTLPGLTEWGRFIDHRMIQLDKLSNVEVILNRTLSAGDILEYGASLVVLATGSTWAADGLNGPTHEPIPGFGAGLTPDQILAGHRPPAGSRIAIYDTDGFFMAASLADLLSSEGYPVDFVTSLEQVAPWCDQTFEGEGLRDRLHGRGVRFHRGVVITGYADGRLIGVNEFNQPFALESDALVPVTQRVPRGRLYAELTADRPRLAATGIEAVYQVGDAVAPRMLADVVFDGHRLGREIDGANPAVPAPYRREVAALTPEMAPPTAVRS